MNDKEQNKILSAYERKALHNAFYDLVTFLEIYIEKADHYPDWQKRGQIKDKWKGFGKVWKDENPEEIKSYMLTSLFGLKVMLGLNKKKDGFLETREELKQEFYQWIDATRINAENCPQVLKSILFDSHEVLESRGDEFSKKLVEESEKELAKWDDEKWRKEMHRGLSAIYKNVENEEKEEQFLIGRQWNEIDLASKFAGDAERGKQNFMQIIGKENSNSSPKSEHRAEREYYRSAKTNSSVSHQEFPWKIVLLISLPGILAVALIVIIMRKRKEQH